MDNDHIGSLEIKESKLPGLKDMKVGTKQTMTIEVEMTGLNKREDWSADMGPYTPGKKQKERPKIMIGSFKILSVTPKKNNTL